MKKVLIVCDYFPPHSGPRMGYLVKYLSRMGWDAYVVAGALPSRGGFEALTGFAKEVHIVPQKKHRKWNLLHVLPMFWPYDYLGGEYDMLAKARYIAKEQKVDVVLSSCTYGMFPNNTAFAVSKEFNLPLVIDIRDLEAQNPHRSFRSMYIREKIDYLRSKLGFLSARRAMSVLHAADALVSVSPWHVQWLKEHCNADSYLVYNGYDPETFIPQVPSRCNCFKIVYMGTLGMGVYRDYTFLLESVHKLYERKVIDPQTFQVIFYSGKIESGNPIRDRIDRMGIGTFFSFRDFVPSNKVSSILNDASVLLVLTNKNGFHGVMTTKFFEYLAVKRPILCMTSDEDVLEAAIHETESGCSARTQEEAERYIESLYNEWKRVGFVTGTTRMDKLEIYSREFQARQFIEIFEQVVQRRDLAK